MAKRIGKQTIELERKIGILDSAAVVGQKEGEGPLSRFFDYSSPDIMFGEDSFERAESKMVSKSCEKTLEKAGLSLTDIDLICGGDLLNQCAASHFAHRNNGIPFIGLYGACSTLTEGICLAALFLDGGGFSKVLVETSSHFCTAERQYRFPLEYGSFRTPNNQWTVTGSGACIIGSDSPFGIYIKRVLIGKIIDLGITDQNNMGAAMAPAAADSIKQFFKDTDAKPTDYDAIFTGDLGAVGTKIVREMLKEEGYDIEDIHSDCGLLIYDLSRQNVRSGGSGCGCSASVFSSYVIEKLKQRELRKILFMSTGALLSPTTTLQGESIPSVVHIVEIEVE